MVQERDDRTVSYETINRHEWDYTGSESTNFHTAWPEKSETVGLRDGDWFIERGDRDAWVAIRRLIILVCLVAILVATGAYLLH